MKKGIISTIIILLFAGFVFYLGFVSFKIPVGKYGVMVSKTSGVYKELLQNGKFCWRWEKIIPRNAKIYVFDGESRKYTQSFTGELPSAKIYSAFVKGEPDFSYSFDFEIYLSLDPQKLVDFVRQENITDETALNEYLEKTAEKISRDLSQHIIELNENTVIASYDVPQMLEKLNLTQKYDFVEVQEVFLKKANVPDLNLYKLAKTSYQTFQTNVDDNLKILAKQQAEKIMQNETSMKQLSKIAEILRQYPELNTLLTNGNAADFFKALKDLK